MFKSYMLIIAMVITMSAYASDKATLHRDFEVPIEKTENQHTLDFFRVWLMDKPGEKILKRALKSMGLDNKKVLKTIKFMTNTIEEWDKRAIVLYTNQQNTFIDQHNEGLPEDEKVTSYHATTIELDIVMEAENAIQAKLHSYAENQVNGLAQVIGEDASFTLKDWIMRNTVFEAPPVDREEYLKEIAEPLNFIMVGTNDDNTQNTSEFTIIKKDNF